MGRGRGGGGGVTGRKGGHGAWGKGRGGVEARGTRERACVRGTVSSGTADLLARLARLLRRGLLLLEQLLLLPALGKARARVWW